MRSVADYLRAQGLPQLQFVSGLTDDSVKVATETMAAGSVVLLENLRFDKGEERNDMPFGQSARVSRRSWMMVLISASMVVTAWQGVVSWGSGMMRMFLIAITFADTG